MYLGSTAVCCDEAMKLVTCLLILTFGYYCKKTNDGGGEYSQIRSGEGGDKSFSDEVGDGDDIESESNGGVESQDETRTTFLGHLRQELQFDWRMVSTTFLCLRSHHVNIFYPLLYDINLVICNHSKKGGLALLYTIQKNLLYLAISNLDAAVFQVTYQAKILTTALFSVLLLGKKLSCRKIVGLLVLTLGVSLVQLDKVEENASKSFQEQKRWVGVLAVLGACCTSGFGGVYFELVLKPRQNAENEDGSPSRPPPSVWAKNVQLSCFAFAIALTTAFLKDHAAILQNGFFQGYSPLVVLVITLEAGGGLVVAAVIKYADNILKSFATAVSIVTSTIVSMVVFGFLISKLFIGGSLLVFVAIYMYSVGDETPRPEQLPSQTSEIAMMATNTERRKGSEFSSGLSSTSEDAELDDIDLELELEK